MTDPKREERPEEQPAEEFPTELTPEGEQYVVPGCERRDPKKPEQGSLW